MKLQSKPFYRWQELHQRYGGALLERLISAKWLVACVRQHRFALYASECVAGVDERIRRGEMPPHLRAKFTDPSPDEHQQTANRVPGFASASAQPNAAPQEKHP